MIVMLALLIAAILNLVVHIHLFHVMTTMLVLQTTATHSPVAATLKFLVMIPILAPKTLVIPVLDAHLPL
jgi:hypothetical protein